MTADEIGTIPPAIRSAATRVLGIPIMLIWGSFMFITLKAERRSLLFRKLVVIG
jgi:hypothetical protein